MSAQASISTDGHIVATAPDRLPLLWIALLPHGDSLRDAGEAEWTVTSTDALSRLHRRSRFCDGELGGDHLEAYAEHLAQMLADEECSSFTVSAAEVAALGSGDEFLEHVDTIVQWMDGDRGQSARAAIGVRAICALPLEAVPPKPREGLDAITTHGEWELVLSLVGAGDAWW